MSIRRLAALALLTACGGGDPSIQVSLEDDAGLVPAIFRAGARIDDPDDLGCDLRVPREEVERFLADHPGAYRAEVAGIGLPSGVIEMVDPHTLCHRSCLAACERFWACETSHCGGVAHDPREEGGDELRNPDGTLWVPPDPREGSADGPSSGEGTGTGSGSGEPEDPGGRGTPDPGGRPF